MLVTTYTLECFLPCREKVQRVPVNTTVSFGDKTVLYNPFSESKTNM